LSILQKILTEKEKEVTALRLQSFDEPPVKFIPTFKKLVETSDTMNVIAEIKRASPSKGEINMGVDPVQQAINYSKNGASAISVLTDKTFFNGSMDDLKAVREAVDIPILCKDFIIDPVQIDQAKAAGANIILLIVAALSDENLKKLYDYTKERGLEALVEVHQESEMEQALNLNPSLLGINNRDLNTFNVSLETTKDLATMVKSPDTIIISESGMKQKEDVTLARDAGAKAILVGETLMESANLQHTFEELKVPRKTSGVN
jgi:indole-3-glycerol phosphate synthase